MKENNKENSLLWEELGVLFLFLLFLDKKEYNTKTLNHP